MQDLSRLTYASTRVGTDLLAGVTRVLGSLAGSLVDTMFLGGPSHRERYYDRDSDYGERGSRGSRYGSRYRGRAYDVVEDMHSALRDAADVIVRSAEDFSHYYDRVRYERDEERRSEERDDRDRRGEGRQRRGPDEGEPRPGREP